MLCRARRPLVAPGLNGWNSKASALRLSGDDNLGGLADVRHFAVCFEGHEILQWVFYLQGGGGTLLDGGTEDLPGWERTTVSTQLPNLSKAAIHLFKSQNTFESY